MWSLDLYLSECPHSVAMATELGAARLVEGCVASSSDTILNLSVAIRHGRYIFIKSQASLFFSQVKRKKDREMKERTSKTGRKRNQKGLGFSARH